MAMGEFVHELRNRLAVQNGTTLILSKGTCAIEIIKSPIGVEFSVTGTSDNRTLAGDTRGAADATAMSGKARCLGEYRA